VLIKLATIDLRKPLQPIYVDARYASLFVWVCWGYVPLGMLRVPCESDTRTVSRERLQRAIFQTFGWQLWEEAVAGTLDRLEVPPDQSLPAISVVVCTRDRALSLQRCLQTLTQLDYPRYEVVVVDNCSRDASIPQIVVAHNYRYVREDTPGLDWARNRGIREATHDIVAYIDDDALATPGWLRGVALGFAEPEVMAVTGMVLPAEIETPAQYDFECYGGMSKGFKAYTIRRRELNRRDLLRAYNWGVGANMAFRRSLFEAIGHFDVALDVGTPTNGAGDIEFFYRTVTAGYALRYEPAAMVFHVHRRDHRALTRQFYNNGRAFPAYLLTIIRNQPHYRRAIVWFALRWWIWDWLLRRLLSSLMRRDRGTLRAALAELWGSCSALWAYRKSRRIALQQLQGRTVTG